MVGAKLIGAWAAVALTLLAFAGAAAAKDHGTSVAFELDGSNGYEVFVLGGARPGETRGQAAIFVGNGHGGAFYSAPATFSATSFEADLGTLGRISLEAQPSGEKRVARSSCDKRHPVEYEAVNYVGEFEFHGEGGYTTASATQLPLKIQAFLDLLCGAPVSSVLSGPGLPGAELNAVRHGLSNVHLKADTNAPGKPVRLRASISERRGAIRIERHVEGRVGASAFTYSQSLGTATLTPPAPFSGHGTFAAPRRRASAGRATSPSTSQAVPTCR